MTDTLDAAGPDQIRTAFSTAVTTTEQHAEDAAGIAGVLTDAADRYEQQHMAPSTVEHLRAAAGALTGVQAHLDDAAQSLGAAGADFDAHDGLVADTVAVTGHLAGADVLTGDTTTAAAEPNGAPVHQQDSADQGAAATAATPSGRPPQQPNAAGALYIDPDDGYETYGRIVNRTKSTADIEWDNGRVQKGVKFIEPLGHGTLRWLTQQELDAERGATRWPVRVRGLDGLVGVSTDDSAVAITAGTVSQVAGIDPQSWRDSNAKDRYALFDLQEDDLPTFTRALGAAGRAATKGKTYRKKINGSDVGDVELTVTAPAQGDPAVMLTVLPYEDTGDLEDWQQTTEADFGTVPDEIDDDTGQTRALTAEERADWQADIRADYDAWKAANPPPQPLAVTLTVPMLERLRERLAAPKEHLP